MIKSALNVQPHGLYSIRSQVITKIRDIISLESTIHIKIWDDYAIGCVCMYIYVYIKLV